MAVAYETFQETKTFGSLNGLRALAILGVIWHHTAGIQAGFPLAQRGFLGVDLFFVLSGFLIATLLLREARSTGGIGLKAFYRRRFLRIMPAYWLMLAIVGAAMLVHHNPRLEHEYPYALLYVSNFVPMVTLLSVTWSLSTEEQFYLVIPALMKFWRRGLPWLLPVLCVGAELPAFGFWPQAHLPAFLRQTTFAPILLGVMLAYALDDPRTWKVLYPLFGRRSASVIALTLALIACSVPSADISGWLRLIIQCSFVILVACCVMREDHALERILSFPVLRRIGMVSYGMYLYHLTLYGIAEHGLHRIGVSSTAALFAALAALVWAVAEISYRWYETPFLRRRYRPQRIVERDAVEAIAAS